MSTQRTCISITTAGGASGATEVATTSILPGGAGDRLSQSVDGAVTTYTLDLYGGLTQVLGDGERVYLYGLGRIGEEGAAGWVYHLGDALGSVRQLADGDEEVVLDRSYRPYGGVLESGGSGGSAYGFAGESTAKHSIFRYSSRWWAAFHLWFERATFFPSVGGNWTDIGPSYGEQVTADQCRVKCRESDTEYLGTRCTAVLRYGPYISDFTSNIQEGVMSVHDFEEIVLKIDGTLRSCMESHTEN